MSKMITRRITTTEVTVTVASIEDRQITDVVLTFIGRFRTEAALQKAINHKLSENLKFLAIKEREIKSTLIGMTEDEFVDHAVVLDEKTRKPITNKEEIE